MIIHVAQNTLMTLIQNQDLIDKGHAYQTEEGVYFHVESAPESTVFSPAKTSRQFVQVQAVEWAQPVQKGPQGFRVVESC